MKFDLCNISQGRQPMLTITLERGAHEHTGTSGYSHERGHRDMIEVQDRSLEKGHLAIPPELPLAALEWHSSRIDPQQWSWPGKTLTLVPLLTLRDLQLASFISQLQQDTSKIQVCMT